MTQLFLLFVIAGVITICLARFVFPRCYKKVPIPEQIFTKVNRVLTLVVFVCSCGSLYYLFAYYNKQVAISAEQRRTDRVSPSGHTGKTSRPDGQREAARVLALEALRQGTVLSVTISSLPKLEKVYQATQKLLEISPRYQEQATRARKTLSDVADKRDRSLGDYLKKVAELSRYKPDYITGALDSIRNGDVTSRERIVLDLLSDHVNSSRDGSGPGPVHWLSEYTQRFSGFVD